MLKLIDSDIEASNHLFFAFKLTFFLLEIVYSLILSLVLFGKSFNFLTIFLFNSLYDLFFIFLMALLDLIDHILDTCKVGVKHFDDLFLHLFAEHSLNINIHGLNNIPEFMRVIRRCLKKLSLELIDGVNA
jgi:hypothetical protein